MTRNPAAVILPILMIISAGRSLPADDDQARVRTISQTLSEQNPLVIAHRGASGYLPEHTTEAAAYAHALGSDFIEQDVVLTKDGIPVVLHDVTLEHVTDVADKFPERSTGKSYFVWNFTLDELRTLSVTERNHPASSTRFPVQMGRFRIATLEEHIQLIEGLNQSTGRNAGLYVEVKAPAQHHRRNLDVARRVLEVLETYGYTDADDRAFIQCFDADEVLRMRTELNCRLPLIQLVSEEPDEKKLAEYSRVADGVGVPISAVLTSGKSGAVLVSDVVRTAHHHALMVHVWTLRTDRLPDFVDSSQSLIQQLVENAHVDGIFTDQPDFVLKWRHAANPDVRLRGPFHLLNGPPDNSRD